MAESEQHSTSEKRDDIGRPGASERLCQLVEQITAVADLLTKPGEAPHEGQIHQHSCEMAADLVHLSGSFDGRPEVRRKGLDNQTAQKQAQSSCTERHQDNAGPGLRSLESQCGPTPGTFT